MPRIVVNGHTHFLPEQPSIAEALLALGLQGRRVAVECNGVIVPRSAHAEHRLYEGDRVEIVAAVGGG